MVNLFLTVDLYGCCCVYIVFVASNIQQVSFSPLVTFGLEFFNTIVFTQTLVRKLLCSAYNICDILNDHRGHFRIYCAGNCTKQQLGMGCVWEFACESETQ